MGNFNRGGGGGFGGGGRGGGSRFGGGDRGGRGGFRREDRCPVTMTQVTCDECKKSCEVPFRPTAGKPVYCNDCFRSQGGGRDDRGRPAYRDEHGAGRDFGGDRPAPRPSFGGNTSNGGGNDTKKQLELLNSKMDKLIASIEVLALTKSNPKTEVVKSMTVTLPKKEAKKKSIKK
ncbi:MAG: CxxC-x17-CxxC domain-containing protein [bacterium]